MRKFFTLCGLLLSGSFIHAQVELKDGSNISLGNFTTITAAYGAIPASISESYVIELSAGYSAAGETFPINFVNKPGASSSSTITIRPAAGATNINITSNVSGAGTFKLTDADFIIFDGRPGGTGSSREMTITNTNAASSSAQIEFINGSSDNIFGIAVLSVHLRAMLPGVFILVESLQEALPEIPTILLNSHILQVPGHLSMPPVPVQQHSKARITLSGDVSLIMFDLPAYGYRLDIPIS